MHACRYYSEVCVFGIRFGAAAFCNSPTAAAATLSLEISAAANFKALPALTYAVKRTSATFARPVRHWFVVAM